MAWIMRTIAVYGFVALFSGGCGTYQGSADVPGSPLDRVPATTMNLSPAPQWQWFVKRLQLRRSHCRLPGAGWDHCDGVEGV